MKPFFSVVILLVLWCIGCKDDPVAPASPEISLEGVTSYKNKSGKDSMIIISINYKDANGNLGLSEADSMPPYTFGSAGYYNLYVAYYSKEGGVWKSVLNPISKDTIHFNQRFPKLNQSKNEKSVSGTMFLRIPATPYPGILPQIVKFRLKMLDRGLRESNSIETPEINLKH